MPAMLFVVSTNSIFKERIPDETDFFTWTRARCPLLARSPICTFTLEVKERLMERLQQESEPFILVGLSLGGVLALDLSRQDFPQLKGLVLVGTQYKLNTNPLYRLQILLFRLLPKHVFEKQDANKQQMLQILTELKGLNLTDTVKACPLPSLVVCGSRDWANQSSSKKLAKLLPKGRYQEIADGGHLLNTEKPYELAQAIKEFVGEFKNEETN